MCDRTCLIAIIAVMAAALAAAAVRLWNAPKEELARRRAYFQETMTLGDMRSVRGSLMASPASVSTDSMGSGTESPA